MEVCLCKSMAFYLKVGAENLVSTLVRKLEQKGPDLTIETIKPKQAPSASPQITYTWSLYSPFPSSTYSPIPSNGNTTAELGVGLRVCFQALPRKKSTVDDQVRGEKTISCHQRQQLRTELPLGGASSWEPGQRGWQACERQTLSKRCKKVEWAEQRRCTQLVGRTPSPCFGLNCALPKCICGALPPAPQNVTVLGDRAFTEVSQLK